MRIALALIAALSLAGGVNDMAMAEGKPQSMSKHHVKKPPEAAHHATAARSYAPRPDAYVERDVNKLPFGSATWWDQMQREGRLGGEMP
jgi:hypothetical protein